VLPLAVYFAMLCHYTADIPAIWGLEYSQNSVVNVPILFLWCRRRACLLIAGWRILSLVINSDTAEGTARP
jgi:hypothetical protein